MGAVLEHLVKSGVETVKASYIPTEKNIIVKDFYEQQGFIKGDTRSEKTFYKWDRGKCELPQSAYIETICQ